jgi:TonB-linked SusC/RagA family outer membrane protein
MALMINLITLYAKDPQPISKVQYAVKQQVTVTGKITDGITGEPLAGASVIIKGTTQGIISNADGEYSISIPEPGAILVFSFIGYLDEEVIVDNQTLIDVQLVLSIESLDEIVVIGYGVQKKSDVTGAISKVKTEDLENRSSLKAEQALQGKTAGVQVINSSGAPGKGGTVRVRGISSNNASEPLFVVDGLIVPNIGNIDPNDIQSMEILKDAASAAIYGVASGNGVIIITTKKGESGKGKITYNAQYMISELPKSPEVLNSGEYINYMTEGAFLTQEAIDAYWNGETNTDWMDAAFEKGITQRHNLAFSGGSDRSTFYASMSYTDQNGIVGGNSDVYTRISGVLNADYKVKDWLKVGSTNNLEKWEMENVSEGSEYGGLLAATLTMDPLTPVSYSIDQMPAYMRAIYDGGTFRLLQDEQGNYYAWSDVNVQDQTNPFIMRDQTQRNLSGLNLNGTVFADLMPLKGLTVTSKLGYRTGYSSEYAYESPYYGNSIVQRENLVISRNNTTFIHYQWDNYATYTRDFNLHSITAMGAVSYIEPFTNTTGGSVNDIQKDDPLYRDIEFQTASAIKTVRGSENNTGRLFSVFGRLSYSYDGKYLFQSSLRRDAGDRNYFPEGNNIGIFPAVSLGWVLSREDFFTLEKINHLKLRASWGQNGTYSHLNGFLWRASIASVGSYPYTEDLVYQNGSAPNHLQNPELTWETTEQTNIGMDLHAFSNRFTFTWEWYTKKSKDLLVTITPPLETGQSSATINAGNVVNTGFEFELGWKETKGEFTYGIQTNMATLKNEVTYLDPGISRIPGARMHQAMGLTVFEEGYPVWYMRGYEFEGVNPEDGEPVFTDHNNDGVINDEDKVMLGSGVPDLTYGITLSAAYKGFDLLVFGAGQHGNQILFAFTRGDRPNSNKLNYFYDDRWTPDNTDAGIPRPGATGMDNYYQSSGVVFDGSFFKIKQIQLGYSLPSGILEKVHIQNLRVYVSLDDWFTFTQYIGYDPETSGYDPATSNFDFETSPSATIGIDKGNYPIPKKVLFGINITL